MATYRIFGPSGGSAAEITRRLGISPTRSAEAGTPVGRRSPQRIRTQSIWQLSSSEDPTDGVELAQSLQKVLDQLTPVAPELWNLMHDGYEADWFCYVGSFAVEHAVELDRDTLTRVLALPGELLLDVYGKEPDE